MSARSFKTSTVSCLLNCLQNKHEPIELPDGETVNIGRTPETQITDPTCSRNQVALTANWSKREVHVVQLGVNNSSIDGKDIGKSNKVTLKGTSIIYIVSGSHPHSVIFKTKKKALDDSTSPSTFKAAIKRSHSATSEDSDAKRRKSEADVENGKREKNKNKSDSSTQKSKDKNIEDAADVENDDSGDSDEDLQEKAAKLAQLKAKASKEKCLPGPNSKKDGKGIPSSVQPKDSEKASSSCSSQVTEKAEWTSHDQLQVFTSKGVVSHRKIAAFDMDGTIIVTKSGKVFPTDRDDWQFFHPNIFKKMKDLNSKGFKIVFFTNQLGVAKGKTNITDLKTKVENIVRKLQVPVQVFIATHEGKYRKPCDGMWNILCNSYNHGKKIEVTESLYVGDAAGREKDWAPRKKKDFSCSDRLFALNIGVKFFTPEEFFLNEKPTQKFVMPCFDPRKLNSDDFTVPSGTFSARRTEVLVLVGFPACGKSFFASNKLKSKGYKIVSRDELGSWQKCVRIAGQYLTEASVAVDNTNLTVEERSRYIKIAKDAKVPCRCFVFTTTIEHCRHNERFRQMSGGSHAKINEMLFNKMKSSYKEPSMKEGFSEVVNVNFVPSFTSASDEARYKQFLLEK